MYRYSERPMIFGFPFNPAECSVFIITFKQGSITLEKNKADLAKEIAAIETKNGKYVLEFRFTQEESGAFVADEIITVQVTYVLNGYRDETAERKFSLDDVMKDEVV